MVTNYSLYPGRRLNLQLTQTTQQGVKLRVRTGMLWISPSKVKANPWFCRGRHWNTVVKSVLSDSAVSN